MPPCQHDYPVCCSNWLLMLSRRYDWHGQLCICNRYNVGSLPTILMIQYAYRSYPNYVRVLPNLNVLGIDLNLDPDIFKVSVGFCRLECLEWFNCIYIQGTSVTLISSMLVSEILGPHQISFLPSKSWFFWAWPYVGLPFHGRFILNNHRRYVNGTNFIIGSGQILSVIYSDLIYQFLWLELPFEGQFISKNHKLYEWNLVLNWSPQSL